MSGLQRFSLAYRCTGAYNERSKPNEPNGHNMPTSTHIGSIDLTGASDTLLGAFMARIESALAASRTGIALAARENSDDARAFIAEQEREIMDLDSKRSKIARELARR